VVDEVSFFPGPPLSSQDPFPRIECAHRWEYLFFYRAVLTADLSPQPLPDFSQALLTLSSPLPSPQVSFIPVVFLVFPLFMVDSSLNLGVPLPVLQPTSVLVFFDR